MFSSESRRVVAGEIRQTSVLVVHELDEAGRPAARGDVLAGLPRRADHDERGKFDKRRQCRSSRFSSLATERGLACL
jgi:hypothetical protein